MRMLAYGALATGPTWTYSLHHLAEKILYAERPSWMERMICYRVVGDPTPPVQSWFSSLLVNYRPSAGALWTNAALEFVTRTLVWFRHVAERGVVRFQCYFQGMWQSGCGVPDRLAGAVRHGSRLYDIAYFIIRASFDSALTYPVCRRSLEIHWSYGDSVTMGSCTTSPTHQYTLPLNCFFHPGSYIQVCYPQRT